MTRTMIAAFTATVLALAFLVAVLAITPRASGGTKEAVGIEAVDQLCVSRCLSSGYLWSYCQRICSY